MSARLSQSCVLGPVIATNRIVMPPLVVWLSDRSGQVTDAHVTHYESCAGPGLQIVEATSIATEGRLHDKQMGIWSDDHVAGLQRLADVIHENRGLAGIQIHHAGGSTNTTRTYGEAPRVPSLSAEGVPEGAIEFTADQIRQTVEAFRAATIRAMDAGFDVIELHGAHSYLISQFLSPATNRRTDDWGGDPERRRRFLVEVVSAARAAIDESGRPVALSVRLGIAASGSRELPVDEGLDAASAAVDAGVDFLHISNGGGIDEDLASAIRSRSPVDLTDADPTLLLAGIAKDRVDVPIIGVAGIRTVERAEAAIESGACDLIAVGRALLADPGWARKALGQDDRPIEPCTECKPACFWFKEPVRCPARRRLAKRGEQKPLEEMYGDTRG